MDKTEINRLSDRYYMYKGLVLAPLASILGTFIVDLAALIINKEPIFISALFMFVIPISYIMLFFIGLPIYFLLKSINLLNAWLFTSLAAIVGYVLSIITETTGQGAAYSIAPSITVAIAFWLLYTYRDPNKAFNPDANKDSRPLT